MVLCYNWNSTNVILNFVTYQFVDGTILQLTRPFMNNIILCPLELLVMIIMHCETYCISPLHKWW